MSGIRVALVELIWNTSQAKGTSISITEANVIAGAILARFMVRFSPESGYEALAEDAEYQEYEAYKAANRGRLQAHRALYPETED